MLRHQQLIENNKRLRFEIDNYFAGMAEQKARFQALLDALTVFEKTIIAKDNFPQEYIPLPTQATSEQVAALEIQKEMSLQEKQTRHQLYADSLQLAMILIRENSRESDEINLLTDTIKIATDFILKKEQNEMSLQAFEKTGADMQQRVDKLIEKRNLKDNKRRLWGYLLIGLGVLALAAAVTVIGLVMAGTFGAAGGLIFAGAFMGAIFLPGGLIGGGAAKLTPLSKTDQEERLTSHLSLFNKVKEFVTGNKNETSPSKTNELIQNNQLLRESISKELEGNEKKKQQFNELLLSLDGFYAAIREKDNAPAAYQPSENITAEEIAGNEAQQLLIMQERKARHLLYADSLQLTKQILNQKTSDPQEIKLLKESMDVTSEILSNKDMSHERMEALRNKSQVVQKKIETYHASLKLNDDKRKIWSRILIVLAVVTAIALVSAFPPLIVAAGLGAGFALMAVGGIAMGSLMMSGIVMSSNLSGDIKRRAEHLSFHKKAQDQLLPKEDKPVISPGDGKLNRDR